MKNLFCYSDTTTKAVLDYLKNQEVLDEEKAANLEVAAKKNKTCAIVELLTESPHLKEKIAELIAHLSNEEYLADLSGYIVEEHADFLPEKALDHGAFLVQNQGKEMLLCLDPYNKKLEALLKKDHFSGLEKKIISLDIFDHIQENFKSLIQAVKVTSDHDIVDTEDAEAAGANTFVYNMLKGSIERDASDIHIDLDLDDNGQVAFKLRYRVDGACTDAVNSSDVMLYRGIVNKLKLDAGLKIDERRLPQDGRISFELNGKIYNFRLSFMPNTVRNQQEEKIVLRQMADVKNCDLYALGILDYDLKLLEESITYPHGFVCVTGPTGSGKTTLLYSLLLQIDRKSKNIITLEDPIEAEIPLVNQSQMFHRIGYDFASGLRVILRQDPDIVMVGEMRDEETASKAFEAANTGHLVFSTLHTNTAASTITRLLQMNVPYYFISSSLKFVVAQRLVRRVEQKSAKKHASEANVLKEIEAAFAGASKPVKALYEAAKKSAKIVQADDSAEGGGYKGRTAIMEVMKLNDDIRHIVNFENGNEDKIQEAAVKNGMLTMQQYGYLKVLEGVTTFEEVNNAVKSH